MCPEGESSFFPTVWEAQIANLSLELKQERGKAAEHQKYTGLLLPVPHSPTPFSEPFWGDVRGLWIIAFPHRI